MPTAPEQLAQTAPQGVTNPHGAKDQLEAEAKTAERFQHAYEAWAKANGYV